MRRVAVAFAILCALMLVAYLPAFGGFGVYEDVHWISEILTPVTLRPTWDLAHWSLSLDAVLGGTTPWIYHMTNVAIHGVNGWLVFVLARQILTRHRIEAIRRDVLGFGLVTPAQTDRAWLAETLAGAESELPALCAAAVFLLHPIQTEAVAYLTGRWELVNTTFLLLALVSDTWISVPCAILAVTTKTSALVVLPLMWMVRETEIGTALVAGAVGLVIGSALWKDATGRVPYLFMAPDGPVEYVARQAVALWRMLALVVVPWGQTIDHDWGSVPLWVIAGAIPALLGAVVGIARRRRDVPLAWLATCWILVCVAPRFVVRTPELLSEHQMYVSMIGIALVVGSWMPRGDARV